MKIFKINGAGVPEPRFKTRRARKAWRRNPFVATGIKVVGIYPSSNFVLKGYETWPSPRDGERLDVLT